MLESKDSEMATASMAEQDERSALITENREVSEVQGKKKLTAVGLLFVGLTIASVLIFAVVGTVSHKSTSFGSSLSNLLSTTSTSSFTWTTTRKGYDPLFFFDPSQASEFLKYKFLDDYDGIIEPYTENLLHIFSDSDGASSYKYEICPSGSSSGSSDCVSGSVAASSNSGDHPTGGGKGTSSNSFTVECDAYDSYSITIKKYDKTHTYMSKTTGSLMCMYVRREMREYTAKDLSDTMDAMKVIWEVSTEEGQAMYGEDYYDIDYLIGFHFYNAAWQDGDHLHEGIGFYPQHIKLTNIFELAMRAVNPSVSLPFWDFTIETATNVSVWDSPMFTPDTFGSMPTPPDMTWGWLYKNSDVDDAMIPDGRWAGAKTGVNTEYLDLVSAYGYMRAPWSMNPSTYITRFTSVDKTLPTCESHYDLASYSDLGTFLAKSPYSAHASTHGVVGGVYGCDAFDELREKGYIYDEEAQRDLCLYWVFYMKELYRHGTMYPQTDCVVKDDVSEARCGFDCNVAMDATLEDQLTHIINSNYEVANLTGDAVQVWKEFVCKGDGYRNFAGDHLEAASAADPSFWPIHPTLERLYQAKLMAGGYPTYDWPSQVNGTDFICSKASCYDSETESIHYSQSCCNGHFEHDKLMLSSGDDGTYEYVGLGNREMMEATDPASGSYSVPYIYSTFDWSHCESKGVYINQLLSDNFYHTTSTTN